MTLTRLPLFLAGLLLLGRAHAAPATPAAPVLLAQTATSIDVGWDKSDPGSEFFVLQMRVPNSATWATLGILPKSGPATFSANGLAPMGQHTFRLAATQGTATSPFSKLLKAFTRPEAPNLMLPTWLTTRGRSADVAIGFRRLLESDILKIEHRAVGTETWSEAVIPAENDGNTGHRLTGLTPGVTYEVRARANVNGVDSVATPVQIVSGAFAPVGAMKIRGEVAGSSRNFSVIGLKFDGRSVCYASLILIFTDCYDRNF